MRLTTLITGILTGLLCVTGACSEPPVIVGDDDSLQWARVVDVPWQPNDALDLLFVVDTSADMAGKQAEVVDSFRRLIKHLEFVDGGIPDLHVGVVSSDMGVGSQYGVPGCTAKGDDGKLLARSGYGQCSASLDRFIRDYRDGNERLQNFEGALEQAFTCISQLGDQGCSFEQPLAAMRSALDTSRWENRDFVRPGAALGVIFVSNEDDCSVLDEQFFRPDLDGRTGLTKFRCIEYGVTCEDDVFSSGTLQGCRAREDSSYVHGVDVFAEFLSDLKFDPDEIVVSGLIGNSNTIQTKGITEDDPEIVSEQCLGNIEDYPAVRLQDFIGKFDDNGDVSPLCGSRSRDALTITSRKLRQSLGTDCMDGLLVDMDPDRAGRQPTCRVTVEYPNYSKDIPACPVPGHIRDTSPVAPCYIIETGGSQCGDFPTQLRLDVWWGKDDSGAAKRQPLYTHVIGECLVEPRAEPTPQRIIVD